MSTETTETQPQFVPTPGALELARKGIEAVVKGKTTLADLLASAGGVATTEGKDLVPPTVPSLSEAQRDAIKRLPAVFNSVVVTSVRKLNAKEQAAIVEERETIDLVLKALTPRKDKAIRETIANHLDLSIPEEEREALPKDSHGHVAKKQDVAVDGTGLKMQRSVSGGKPNLNIGHIEALHAEGKIDRKTYLAITKKPDLPRVMDEDGLHKAIQKDPSLFFLLATVAEPTSPITTIKVVPTS
jgi:hypothetical protein